ncbi:MAG: hypothetical protein AB7O45_11145, partial [Alphaproteobacteria bacterium]
MNDPSPGDLAALLDDGSGAVEWIAEIHPYDAEAGREVALRWSSHGMTTAPDASLPNAYLPDRLLDFQFRKSLWRGDALLGESAANEGLLLLDNADGGLDGLSVSATGRRYHFRRRRARVLAGHPTWGFDDFVPVFTGQVEELSVDDATVSVQLRDPLDRLDRPVQEAVFGGDRMLVTSSSPVAVGTGARSWTIASLLTNGTFAADLAGWTAGAGWSHAGGRAAKSAGTAADLAQTVATAAGVAYLLRFAATRTAGTLAMLVDGVPVGTSIVADGTQEQRFVAAGSSTALAFRADAAFAGTIDDVSVRPDIAAAVDDEVRAARTAALTTTWLAGRVTAWDRASGVLAIDATAAGGTGTHADWSIWVRPYAGTEEQAGKTVPFGGGTARHVEPVELGVVQGLHLWRYNDGPGAVEAVFDGGLALAMAGSFPPAPGEAFVDPDRGIVWTASTPVFPLTVTLAEGGGVRAERLVWSAPGSTSFVVPSNVAAIAVKCWGGGGGAGGNGDGGGGGHAAATLAVTPGETLTVSVGSGGQPNENTLGGAGGSSAIAPGGAGGGGGTGLGGGGGGGASGVRRGAGALLMAGGGGGGAANAAGGAGG